MRTLGVRLEELPGVQVRPRVWHNPEMRSANFMIPGIIGMILYFLTALFTALAIVREREQGTIELLIVTPIRPLELGGDRSLWRGHHGPGCGALPQAVGVA